jgi:CubicO group peptidase (beta-lactamase class C family)
MLFECEERAMESAAWIDEAGGLTVEGIASPIPWWSFTKTVLAIAALRLVDSDRLSLSAPGSGYSLTHLLRHEAGLPDYGGVARYHEDVAAGKAPWPVARLLDVLDAERLRYEPGNGWAYSNVGYLKVGQLIERASGLPLGKALDNLVFEPAGLATARLATAPEHLTDVQMGGVTGYHPGWVYHGLVTGTTADSARLLRALLTGALLQPETFERMFDGRALPEHRTANYPDPAYGFGLMFWATNPLKHPIGHTGGGPGSGIAVYSQGGRTCAIWAAPPSTTDPVAEVFSRLANGCY